MLTSKVKGSCKFHLSSVEFFFPLVHVDLDQICKGLLLLEVLHKDSEDFRKNCYSLKTYLGIIYD